MDSPFAKWRLPFKMEAASRKFVTKFSFEFLAAHFLNEIWRRVLKCISQVFPKDFLYISCIYPIYFILSCLDDSLRQLYIYPCNYLTHYRDILLFDINETWPDQKKAITKTDTKTKTNTVREHIQRPTLDTFDLWDIWSEWLWDMTWPKKTITKTNTKTKTMTNTFREHIQRAIQRLVTFETYDHRYYGTWPDHKKGTNKDKHKHKDKYI